MARKYSWERETAGEKAKKKVKSFFLKVAFWGAVIGGPGYHHYGTQEQITAKVTSVEAETPGETNGAIIVHTDKGDFVNERSRLLHLKGAGTVSEFDDMLKPGAEVKITVYGAIPFVDRNIIGVDVITPAPVNQTAETPPVKTVETLPPVVGTTDDGKQDYGSYATSDLTTLQQKIPQLYRDLNILSQLPITGKGVYDVVTKPENKINSSVYDPNASNDNDGHYSNNLVKVAQDCESLTADHEYFHAAQDINEGPNDMFKLTMGDGAFCNLLQEASAVAYELSVEKEAANRGITLFTPAAEVTQEGNMTTTQSIVSASDDEGVKSAFNTAYDKAWEDNASLDETARETKALEAGGQAVVTYLLEGKEPTWANCYSQLASVNANNNAHAYAIDGREKKEGYKDTRNAAFKSQGFVSSTLNFVPEKYLGPDADKNIQECLNTLGLKITGTQKQVARKYSAPGPG